MKKQLISCILFTALALTACGNQAASGGNISSSASAAESSTEVLSTEVPASSSEPAASDAQTGSDISFTLSASYSQGQTQDDLDAYCKEQNFTSAILNADGSITYTMPAARHEALLEEVRNTIVTTVDGLVGTEEYPNLVSVEYDDNLTEFTVTTKSTEPDIDEVFLPMLLVKYGELYHIYQNLTVDNIVVTFVNADSGEVIHTANSSEVQK